MCAHLVFVVIVLFFFFFFLIYILTPVTFQSLSVTGKKVYIQQHFGKEKGVQRMDGKGIQSIVMTQYTFNDDDTVFYSLRFATCYCFLFFMIFFRCSLEGERSKTRIIML
jgi:hypothetical protein